jgi:ribose transport system substrate-binding protein
MTRSATRQVKVLATGVLISLLIAACGSSSSSSTSSAGSSNAANTSSSSASSSSSPSTGGGGYLGPGPTGLGIRPSTGARAAAAEAAGKTAAQDAGGPVTLPGATIGIINFLNGIESSDRLADTTKYAAAQLGWKSIVCDGKGTPTQFVACGNSLLDQGVKGIIEIAIEPGQMQSVLTKAKQMNVPVVQVGGGAVPTGLLTGNYGPNEAQSGKVLTDALLAKLDALPGNPQIVVHNFPAAWGAVRTDQLQSAVAQQSKVKIATTVTTDAANLVPFTRTAVTTQLTQVPDAKAYWFTFDTTGQVGGQVISAKFPGQSFPKKPLVVTFHADLGTLQLMRQGKIDMTSEVNYDAAVWEGLDNMAELFARKRPMMQANQPVYPVIGDPFTYQIVTKDNLPPAGQYVPPKWDVPSYFIAKWKAEFGK